MYVRGLNKLGGGRISKSLCYKAALSVSISDMLKK